MSELHARMAGFLRHADHVLEAITSTILVAIIAINAAEIVTRSFLGASFDWIHEINLLLANWLYFLGICLVYYRQQDITIDFVLRLFKGGLRAPFLITINLLTIATLLVVVWYGWELLALQVNYKTMGLGLRNHWFTLPVVIGAAMMIAIVLRQSLDLWLRRDALAAPEEPA